MEMDGWRPNIEADGKMESKKVDSMDGYMGNPKSTIFMNIEADKYVGNPIQPSYKNEKCSNEGWTKLKHITIEVGNMNGYMKNPYSTIL